MTLSSFKNFSRRLSRLLLPKSNVAALEIKDAVLRLVQFYPSEKPLIDKGEGDLKKVSVSLEPGVIENGLVKDKKRFSESLTALRRQFTDSKDKIPVIAIIPSANVYAKAFNLPLLAENGLEKAAELNLESISPIDFQSAYADWERAGVEEKEGKVELLGAFAGRPAIDDYVNLLNAVGFLPVAIEFPALAIARAVREYGIGIDQFKPHVAVNISSDGINFMIFKNGNLYFDYFAPWKLIRGEEDVREILFEDFKGAILGELKKVSVFYGSHWGGKLDKLILITQALDEEISKFIKENFDFEVIRLQLRGFISLPSSWFAAIGGAIRGELPRAEDNLISLAPVGTEKEYWQSEIIVFVKIWRNIFIAAFGFLFIVFLAADSFLARTAAGLAKKNQEISKAPGGEEVAELQERARIFNQVVDKAMAAKEQSRLRSPLLEKINILAKNISFSKISVNGELESVFLIGKADNEAAAIEFKNKLIEEGFKKVSLPLSDLEANPDGTVSFSLTFYL